MRHYRHGLTPAVAASALADCQRGRDDTDARRERRQLLHIVPQFPDRAGPCSVIRRLPDVHGECRRGGSPREPPVSAPQRMAYAAAAGTASGLPNGRKLFAQRAAEKALFARAAHRPRGSTMSASLQRPVSAAISRATVPPLGSIRSFHVANSFTVEHWVATVAAKSAGRGANVPIHIRVRRAPRNGFTPKAAYELRRAIRPDALPDRHDGLWRAIGHGRQWPRHYADVADRECRHADGNAPGRRPKACRLLRFGRLPRRNGRMNQRRDLLLYRSGHARHFQLRARRWRSRTRRAWHVPARAAASH